MPKAGQVIEIAQNVDGSMFARLEPSFDTWHEVVTVQTPHGPLTDINKLKNNIEILSDKRYSNADWYKDYRKACIDINEIIDAALTIIEAEEGEDE